MSRTTPKKNPPRPANQRLSTWRQRRQQHLLDVRVRSRRASHHRNRRLLVLLSKVVLAVGICAGIYFGIREGLNRFFFENPDYRLSTIEVKTDGSLPREQVLEATGLVEGVNIFSVNLGRVHARLQELAQVDEAQVERKMPNEIDIQITERRPIAWITSEKTVADPFASDAAFLVDARGILMKEKKLLPEYLALPLITGCADEALVPGKMVGSFTAKSALELLRLTTTSFMQTRFQIRDIDLSKGYCLLVTDKNHIQVLFGFEDLEKQMQRLEQLLVYADDSRREIETVNLLVARNIPVTFAKPAAEIISELEKANPAPPEPVAAAAAPKKEPAASTALLAQQEPEVRRAQRAEPPVRRATAVSPGVREYHSRAPALPVRKAIPLQRFNQEKDGNG